MELNVYAFTCGWLTLPAALLLAGEKGKLTVPVPSYLIEHPKGRVIFDTGLHVDTQTDPSRRLGRLAPIHTVGFKPGEEIAARLSSLEVAPAKIDFIINSHLHFDHCGGNEQLPNATLLIQRREWEAGHNADLIESVYYDPHDYDHGHQVKLIDGEHDLFGDGRVVCIPTPGHTPGHQSLLVHLKKTGDVVLSGDVVHFRSNWDNRRVPGFNYDKDKSLASMDKITRILDEKHAQLWINHDRPSSDARRHAPEFYE